MIDRERMQESKAYRDGVMAGVTFGATKTIAKVLKLMTEDI